MGGELCLFRYIATGGPRIGVVREGRVIDLTGAGGFDSLSAWLALPDPVGACREAAEGQPVVPMTLADLEGSGRLLAPIDRQEVWAAGVTYLRSKVARMEESKGGGSFYDRVYEAERPELFLKATPSRVVGPGGSVRIRTDSRWNVPEPELALLVAPGGKLIGYTLGNDMSSRDIEGANPLYLPQAKVYRESCALGPVVVLEEEPREHREFQIRMRITRGGESVFVGETSTERMKRRFGELIEYLMRDNLFPDGAFLLTGTGVIPPDEFTLEPGDQVEIGSPGIGVLRNEVVRG
jgi:2-dehydro-3-deoxy-D-arabinonate dehydratase